MSNLADVEDVVLNTPLTPEQRARLFFDLLQALHWEIDCLNSVEDALIYLEER